MLIHQGDYDSEEELKRLDLDCPDDFVYLVEWGRELLGRSGAGLSGIAPLSYREIEAWSNLLRIEVDPLEVHALIRIDAAFRRPEDFMDDDEEESVKKDDSWGPRKKDKRTE